MIGFRFFSEGVPCSGQIVASVGDALVIQGLAQDSSAGFVQLGQEFRRFDSLKAAEDYAAELAQDAPSKEDLKAFRDFEHGAKIKPGSEKLDKDDPDWDDFDRPAKLKRGKDAEMATDPPVSEKQRRAMYAAKAGKSTLGIPKKVGKEFLKG